MTNAAQKLGVEGCLLKSVRSLGVFTPLCRQQLSDRAGTSTLEKDFPQ